jgi:hypothetical protein
MRSTTSPVLNPNANLDRRPKPPFKSLGVALQFLLNSERSAQRTLRMVLVRRRRTKHREDAVTSGLRNVAIVPMHRVHHQVQHRVNDRAGLFRVELPHQLG